MSSQRRNRESRRYFDAIAEQYKASDLSPEAIFWRNHDLHCIRSALPVSRSGFVDLGCGNGFYTEEIAPLFSWAVGVDLSRNMLLNACAGAQGSGRDVSLFYVIADAALIDRVLRKPVSFVLSVGSALCYTGQFWKTAESVLRVLEPGGRFFFELWNKAGLLLRAQRTPDHFRKLRRSIQKFDSRTLRTFVESGITAETAFTQRATLTAYEPQAVTTRLKEMGYECLDYYGRKITEAVIGPSLIKDLIRDSEDQVANLETTLSQLRSAASIAASTFYVAERKS